MDSPRVRIATRSGLLALGFSSALLATGAPAWVLAIATVAGIAVIWRYTGAFALMRADWAEAKQNERRRHNKRDDR